MTPSDILTGAHVPGHEFLAHVTGAMRCRGVALATLCTEDSLVTLSLAGHGGGCLLLVADQMEECRGFDGLDADARLLLASTIEIADAIGVWSCDNTSDAMADLLELVHGHTELVIIKTVAVRRDEWCAEIPHGTPTYNVGATA